MKNKSHFLLIISLQNTNISRLLFIFIFLMSSGSAIAQGESSQIDEKTTQQKKITDSIPNLIPQKREGKFGYVNRDGKLIIKPEYSNVGFFTEDCNLLNSPDKKVRKFGSKLFASVTSGEQDFRIDKNGKKVYQFKTEDLAKCEKTFTSQLFHAYVQKGFYGIIEDSTFNDPLDFRQFKIYPQYQYLYILVGDDPKNPMIIATYNNYFGIVDVNNKIIIPFEYTDIKRNFSWKLAKMFEVTKDGENYYFIDSKNNGY